MAEAHCTEVEGDKGVAGGADADSVAKQLGSLHIDVAADTAEHNNTPIAPPAVPESTAEVAAPALPTSWIAAAKSPLLAPHIVNSSNGTPFIVLSTQAGFIDGIPATPAPVYDYVLKATSAWGSSKSAACSLLADFEGECPGFGGELTVGQFLLTTSVCPHTYKVNRAARPEEGLGLLINMRDVPGAGLVQCLMSNPNIAKIMWGTDGDIRSLRWQENLGCTPSNVVDVQLQYSPSPTQRLGMGRALRRIYGSARLQRLPTKEGNLSFLPRILNKRILPFPISLSEAKYSMDDLHRIEALVCELGARSVEGGKLQVDAFLKRVGTLQAAVERLRQEHHFFKRKYGQETLIKGVELLRGVIHMKKAFPSIMQSRYRAEVENIELAVRQRLRNTNATIPTDLSFVE